VGINLIVDLLESSQEGKTAQVSQEFINSLWHADIINVLKNL
jgi:hypothetical protein